MMSWESPKDQKAFPRKKTWESPFRTSKFLVQKVYRYTSNNYTAIKATIEKVDQVTRVGFTQGFLVKSLLMPCQPSRFWVSLTPCCVDQSHHSNQGPPWKADGRPQNGRRRKGCSYRSYRVQKVLRKNTFQNVQVVGCFPNCSTQSFTRSETGNSK